MKKTHFPGRHFLAAALCLSLVAPAALLGRPVQAQDDPPSSQEESQYRQLIADAVNEFQLGQWAEAIVLFRRAHRLRPSAKTHRGLGQAYYEARDYVQAIPHLRAAIDAPDGTFTDSQRVLLQRTLERALAFVATLHLELDPKDAVVTLNGSRLERPSAPQWLNPGTHTLIADAEGYKTYQQRVSVEGGTDRTLRVALVAERDPAMVQANSSGAQRKALTSAPAQQPVHVDSGLSTLQTLGWVSAGLSLASLVGGVILWRVHEDGPASDWLDEGCNALNRPESLDAPCSKIDREAADLKLASAGAFVAGGVLAATAVTLFLVSSQQDRLGTGDATAGTFACGIGPGALACRGSF